MSEFTKHIHRDWLTALRFLLAVVSALSLAKSAFADVVSYEASVLPEQAGWTLFQNYCNTTEWIADGWFFQEVELCPGDPPPGGQQADYTRSLTAFIGVPTFFVQWRLESTADAEELPWGGGSILACGGFGGVNYIVNNGRDEVEIWRDNTLPILHLPIEPGIAHTFRLELVGSTSYAWFIDGQLVDSGIPEGPFPASTPVITFRTKAAWTESLSRWDYVRFGTIPQPHSGDYDSDGDVDHDDLYFFTDCLLSPSYDASGPGCTWADMNNDGVANGADIQTFVNAMLGS